MRLNKNTQVMIFDSGVGGLSICEAVTKKRPDIDVIFACDNEGFPYGTKSEAELVTRVETVLTNWLKKFEPDMLVVACNTASTVALPKIRGKFNLPIVGVVPAIKPAAALSKTKVIGLLATPATIARPYTQQLIDKFAKDCQFIRVGSSELVQIAEDKMRGKKIDSGMKNHAASSEVSSKIKNNFAPQISVREHASANKRVSEDKTQSESFVTQVAGYKTPSGGIKKILEPFFVTTMLDTIVLACTHFPLLKEEFTYCTPYPVTWIDSGRAIAERVDHLLNAPHHDANNSRGKYSAVFTIKNQSVNELLPALRKMGFSSFL